MKEIQEIYIAECECIGKSDSQGSFFSGENKSSVVIEERRLNSPQYVVLEDTDDFASNPEEFAKKIASKVYKGKSKAIVVRIIVKKLKALVQDGRPLVPNISSVESEIVDTIWIGEQYTEEEAKYIFNGNSPLNKACIIGIDNRIESNQDNISKSKVVSASSVYECGKELYPVANKSKKKTSGLENQQ